MPIAIETASEPWHPVDLDGASLAIVVLAVVFSFISAIVVSLRIYVRVTIRCFGVDDWFMCIGTLAAFVHNAAAIRGAISGLGTVDTLLTVAQSVEANKAVLVWEISVNLAFGFVKTSICCALMRLAVQRSYRVILWISIIATWLISTWEVIASAIIYRPGNQTCVTGPDPACSDPTSLPTAFQFAIYITVDAVCTILPFLLLRNLQMGTRAKLSTAMLLGLGSLATIASIVRLPLSLKFNYIDDRLYHRGRVIIWTVVEVNVGIVAGSMPAVRKLFRWVAEDFSWHPKPQTRAQANNYTLGTIRRMMGGSGPTRLRTPDKEATDNCCGQDVEMSHNDVHVEDCSMEAKILTNNADSDATTTTLGLSRDGTINSGGSFIGDESEYR